MNYFSLLLLNKLTNQKQMLQKYRDMLYLQYFIVLRKMFDKYVSFSKIMIEFEYRLYIACHKLFLQYLLDFYG